MELVSLTATKKDNLRQGNTGRNPMTGQFVATKGKNTTRPGTTVKESVKGGAVYRSAKTGQFVSVASKSGTRKSSSASVTTMKEIAEKRKEALKRLSDR